MNQKIIRASHIAVGSELTSGQTLNTNSHNLAGYLQKKGVVNDYHLIVPDNKALIQNTLQLATSESDWIFVYGGLGPTTDDFTRNVIAEWTGLNLEFNESVWQYIQNYLKGRNYPVREFQKQQAYFPKGAEVMENSKGTAHGFCFPWKDKMFFVLPGPPKEITSICENFLYNYINKATVNNNAWLTYIWNTIGLGESEVANKIEQELNNYKVEVGYRVHLPYVEVKVSFFKSELQKNQNLLDKIDLILKPLLAYKDQPPFKDFFKNLLVDVTEFSIKDEFSNGLIFDDFKKWTDNFSNKKIDYKNFVTEFNKENYLNIYQSNQEHVKADLKINSQLHTFEVERLPVIKLPIERQILFIKEMLYLAIIKKLSKSN